MIEISKDDLLWIAIQGLRGRFITKEQAEETYNNIIEKRVVNNVK